MKYLLSIIVIVTFFAAGCSKSEQQPQPPSDCLQAEYPFACYLDNALSAKNPNSCDQEAISRITCLTAYEEIMETSVSCADLSDPLFRQECEDYKRWESANMQESADPSSGLIIDVFGDE
jgi:hypothetical protein